MNDCPRQELKSMSILVVDDLEDMRTHVITLLECAGFENLLSARDGAEAVTLLESGRGVDLVLLDIYMPEMSGYEVLARLKANEQLRSIPVIMITAVEEFDSLIRCVERGAEDYLIKPVTEALLRVCVQANLERRFLRNKERELLDQVRSEKAKSEDILYQVIPQSVAERLRKGESTIADNIDDVTVVFTDLVGFTALSTRMEPADLVSILNQMFSALDDLASEHSLEKIKTIGDSYMAVAGIPPLTRNHVDRSMEFSLAALECMESINVVNGTNLQLKIGMHTGPVVAGIVGQTRYTFDLWGETVNLASRMETLGVPGKIQLTASTYSRLHHAYDFEPRGTIEVKGKGEMETYLVCRDSAILLLPARLAGGRLL